MVRANVGLGIAPDSTHSRELPPGGLIDVRRRGGRGVVGLDPGCNPGHARSHAFQVAAPASGPMVGEPWEGA
jgi:hypothetical protein